MFKNGSILTVNRDDVKELYFGVTALCIRERVCVCYRFLSLSFLSFALIVSLQTKCRVQNHDNSDCLRCIQLFEHLLHIKCDFGLIIVYLFKCHLSRFGFIEVHIWMKPLLIHHGLRSACTHTHIKYTKFMNTNLRSFTLEQAFSCTLSGKKWIDILIKCRRCRRRCCCFCCCCRWRAL